MNPKKIILSSAMAILVLGTNSYAGVGEDAYNASCAACHGAKGAKPILPTYPKLNGQNAAYTVKQLKDFQSGARKDASMNAMSGLVKGKEQAVADYLAAQ